MLEHKLPGRRQTDPKCGTHKQSDTEPAHEALRIMTVHYGVAGCYQNLTEPPMTQFNSHRNVGFSEESRKSTKHNQMGSLTSVKIRKVS